MDSTKQKYSNKVVANTDHRLAKKSTILMVALFFINLGFAQGFNINGFHFAPPFHFCDTAVSISISTHHQSVTSSNELNYFISGTNLNNRTYDLTVDWGTGSVTTHTGTAISSGASINWLPALQHSYDSIGAYTLLLTLQDSATSQTITSNRQINIDDCQEIFDYVIDYDCDLDAVADSIQSYFPIGSLYLSNGSDTIHPNQSTNHLPSYQYAWPDSIPAGSYNIIVDSIILASYGMSLHSISHTTVTLPIAGPAIQLTAVIGCLYTTCLDGYLFCDANANGLYDSNETTIANGSITVNVNGISETVYSDSSGYYSTSRPTSSETNTIVNVDNIWAVQNSYGALNALGIYNNWIGDPGGSLNLKCDSSDLIDIPLICNTSPNDFVCFDGFTFLDMNSNGLKDSTEIIIPNVPMSVQFRDTNGVLINTATVYSDSLGYYSYSQYFPSTNSVDLAVWSFWLTNNNFTTIINPTSLNFHCDSAHFRNIALIAEPLNPAALGVLIRDHASVTVCDTFSISVSPNWFDTTATTDLNLYFSGTNLLNQTYIYTVNWGDGTTSTHTGASVTNNHAINWTPELYHIYNSNSSSTYGVSGVLSAAQNFPGITTTTVQVSAGVCNNYAIDLSQSLLDCDNDGIVDDTINLNLSLNSVFLYNSTDTIYPVINNQYHSWPNTIIPGTYNIGYSPTINYWFSNLQANTSNAQTVTFPSNGTIPVIHQLFNCVPDTICFDAFVFCDANGNGIFDSGELELPNAPLTISLSGSTNLPNNIGSGITDNTGHFSRSWVAFDSSNFNLDLDSSWLATNGYIAQNSSFYFNSFWTNSQFLNCDTLNVFNIPIICNATASDSICVNGQVFCDINGNGVLDSNETVIPNAPVNIQNVNGGLFATTLTDSLANYSYSNYHPNTDTVNVTITSWWLNQNGYNPISPITVSTLDCSINADIAIDCNIPQPCDNTWINIFGVGPYYQNWTNTMALTFGNSNFIFPGSVYTISIVIPNGSSLDTAAFPISNYTLNGDTLSWTQTINNFDSLQVDFIIDAGIPDSTLHTYQAFISGPNLNCNVQNNAVSYTAVVGNSFDPNNKLVNLPRLIDPNAQEAFYYVVNFQNTGTAPAQDVFIEDQLSQHLDWGTLEVLNATHHMFYTVDASGMLVFTFPQIWLPDSTTNEPLSKGYVTFKIKEALNVPLNDPIENTAYIYFDLNPPIITNTTVNINSEEWLGLKSNKQETIYELYPNPSNGMVTIASNKAIDHIILTDLSGKRVYEQAGNANIIQLDLHYLESGVYIVTVFNQDATAHKRLIIK